MVAAVITINIGLAVACLILVFWLRQLQLALHRFNAELSFVCQDVEGMLACVPQYLGAGQSNIRQLRQQAAMLRTVQDQISRGVRLLGLLYTVGTRLKLVKFPIVKLPIVGLSVVKLPISNSTKK